MSENDASLEVRKKHALECRKVRLYIAQHPGCTSLEIRNGTGVRSDHPLFYMLSLKLIRFTSEKEKDGRRPQRWYVVPQ